MPPNEGGFLNGEIPEEYLYNNPDGERAISPSIEQIRKNAPWLAEQDKWIVWHWNDEAQKIPHRGASPYKQKRWQEEGAQASLEDAWETYQKSDRVDGIGFVFNGTEDEILEDFDASVNPWAFTVSDPCLEDALEYDDEPAFFSSSGTGAHRYPVASNAEDTSNHPHEVYIGDAGNNRWAAVTGWKIAGDTHGPDRSERVNELSEKYNESGAKTVDLRDFEFEADPADIAKDAPVPDEIRDAFSGDVPRCVSGLIHVLGTHDPLDEDGPGWGQQTFLRYSHLMMLLAKLGEDVDAEKLVKLVASFKSPAITAAQRGKHPKKAAKPKPYGEGVPWDLDYQAGKIAPKVENGDLYPPSVSTIEEHCNIKIGDCGCKVHDRGSEDGGQKKALTEDEINEHAHTLDRRKSFATIEDVELPQTHSYVLDKPPRAGGSYAILQDFTAADSPFMVLAPRHSILEYHVETVSDLVDSDRSIVHLKGKARVCESNNSECDLIPRDRDAYQDAMTEIRNIVHRGHIITPEDAPAGICKHWFLSKAAEFADVILTVPQIARRVDVERENMKLFIDEEQTLDYFHPGAIDLVTVGAVTESDGSTTVQLRGAPILEELDTLHEIVETINADEDERAKEGKTDQYHEQSHEADIKAAVSTIEDIADALGVTDAKRGVLDRGEEPTLKATVQELKDRLAGVGFPEPDTDPDQLIEQLSEYARPYFWSDAVDPAAALTAVLFQYEDHPFHWKQTGGEFTVRLIGDKQQVFHKDFFREFDQLAIIAGPGGERFIEKVRPDPVAVELESFPYADEFVVIPVGKRRDGDMEPVDSQRRRVERVTQELNSKPHPHIAVTGTKDRAEQLDNSLVKTTSNVVAEPDNPALELYKMWTAAETAVIYENSIVSRGIDAPYFDVTTVISPGFATPYWEARGAEYRGEDDREEEYLEAMAVQQELKDRELTNAALRMSHTYDTADGLGTKCIITAFDDADRLKYLDGRVTPKMTYADQVADLVSLLTAQGSFQAELENVNQALGGGHKDFTAVALEELFSESPIERPSYTFEEVEEWVESAYINDEKVKAVLRSVERQDEPTTSDVVNDVKILSHGRTKAILNVLERKGWVISMKGNSSGGRPPTIWNVSDRAL